MNIQKKRILSIIYYVLAVISLLVFCFLPQIESLYCRFLSYQQILSIEGDLSIHYLDVGEANAVAFKLPSGEVGMIDAGGTTTSLTVYNYLKSNLLDGDDLDFLILTHTDEDHIGGSLKLLDCFNVKNIFIPNIPTEVISTSEIEDSVYNEFYRLVDCEIAEGSSFRYIVDGLQFSVGEVDFLFYGPLGEYSSVNNYSPAIQIKYCDKTFMFLGDMQTAAETDLASKYGNSLKCDVLMVAHHGASTSNSLEMLRLAGANYAIISVGENSYGHPTSQTLERLLSLNYKIITTMDSGNICFYVNESGMGYVVNDYSLVYKLFDIKFIIFLIYLLVIWFGISVILKVKKFNNELWMERVNLYDDFN